MKEDEDIIVMLTLILKQSPDAGQTVGVIARRCDGLKDNIETDGAGDQVFQ